MPADRPAPKRPPQTIRSKNRFTDRADPSGEGPVLMAEMAQTLHELQECVLELAVCVRMLHRVREQESLSGRPELLT